jgi:phospholipid transport system substrate-binding protein
MAKHIAASCVSRRKRPLAGYFERGMPMNRIVQRVSLILLLLAATLSPLLVAPANAQTDPAAAQVQTFYDGLVASMKTSGGAKARAEKLRPAVEQAYDLSGMTALSVGTSWGSIAAADQKALTDAFARMTIANYARNFDSFHGEKFTVDPAATQRGADKFVKSTLNPSSGAPIAFNYRLHQVGDSWKIVDVYLAGNISQLAQKRSDFASTLASGGPQALAKKMNAIADQMLAG